MASPQKKATKRSNKHYIEMLDMTAQNLSDFALLIRHFVDDNEDFPETVNTEELIKFIGDLQTLDTSSCTLHAKLLKMGTDASKEQTKLSKKRAKKN